MPHAHLRDDGELFRPPRAAHDHRRQGHGRKYDSRQTLHWRHGVDDKQTGELGRLNESDAV